jgi:hypothetical protein
MEEEEKKKKKRRGEKVGEKEESNTEDKHQTYRERMCIVLIK